MHHQREDDPRCFVAGHALEACDVLIAFRLPRQTLALEENERVISCAGTYDRIARAADTARLHETCRGSALLRFPQGRFGYRMMPAVWQRLDGRGLL